MFNFFKKEFKNSNSIQVDIHSHLLPGIDDGVNSFELSVEIIKEFIQLGYKKIITTPHVMEDFYPNTKEIIEGKLNELKKILLENNLDITVEAAAEYYLDNHFLALLENQDKLLLIDQKYILFETSYINEPSFLKEVVFKINTLGMKPILAHPERYIYLHSHFSLLEELIEMGLYVQININSIIGYYSKHPQKLAHKLIDLKKVHFLGTDCHHLNHLNVLKKSIESKYYKKALDLDLLNNSIL